MKDTPLSWKAAWFPTPHFPSLWLKRFALASSLLMLLALPIFNAVAPDTMAALFAKDNELSAPGGIEHATVVVLFPGIVAGIYAAWKFKHRVTHPLFRAWPLLWALACIYFAGEEASWGQWYFGWDTPETFAAVNDQQETNFHNMSSWLDQKPRALVELFIFIGGCFLPFWHLRYRDAKRFGDNLLVRFIHWLSPPMALIGAAALFMLVRIFDWITHPSVLNLGNSELREFTVAWFLSLYLISLAMRARASV